MTDKELSEMMDDVKLDLFGVCNGECCECTRYICPFGENDESKVHGDEN